MIVELSRSKLYRLGHDKETCAVLKEIKITNFRGFRDEAIIKVAPVTILIGNNNSGKSSIVKLLRLLKQSLAETSTEFLLANGSEVQFPSLIEQKNKLSRMAKLKFSLSLQNMGSPGDQVHKYMHLKKMDKVDSTIVEHFTMDTAFKYRAPTGGEIRLETYAYGNSILNAIMNVDDDTRFLKYQDNFTRKYLNSLSKQEFHDRQNILEYVTRLISEYILNISCIGPLRRELTRGFDMNPEYAYINYVGHQGEYTLANLFRLHQENSEKAYKFICNYLKKMFEIEIIGFEQEVSLAYCNARNCKTNAKTNIAELGFGIHQCLPILVQGVLQPRYTTMVIEEPEAQIHPTAQLELGSYFADLWNDYKVVSIVETHSANMLLRLQHLVKKGQLKSEDVSVAYFHTKDNRVAVNNLSIGEDGDLEDGLPMVFFNQDVLEVLEMGAK